MLNLHREGAVDAAPEPKSDPKSHAARSPDFLGAVREMQRAGKQWMRQLGRSHKDHAEFAAQLYAFAEAHQDVDLLVGALRGMGIKVPKASRDKHFLLATKLAAPKADTKVQSCLSRALEYTKANRSPDQPIIDFIAKSGGVDACARAYAKARRGATGTVNQVSESGIDRLRAVVMPTEIVGEEIVPDGAGVYLLVVERQPDGVTMSYGFVADAKLIDRACRVVGQPDSKG